MLCVPRSRGPPRRETVRSWRLARDPARRPMAPPARRLRHESRSPTNAGPPGPKRHGASPEGGWPPRTAARRRRDPCPGGRPRREQQALEDERTRDLRAARAERGPDGADSLPLEHAAELDVRHVRAGHDEQQQRAPQEGAQGRTSRAQHLLHQRFGAGHVARMGVGKRRCSRSEMTRSSARAASRRTPHAAVPGRRRRGHGGRAPRPAARRSALRRHRSGIGPRR